MKKFLLCVFALFAAMTMNAQSLEIGIIDGDIIYEYPEVVTDAEKGTIKYELPAGTMLGTTDHVTCTNLYLDDFATTSVSYGLVVAGNEVNKNGSGLQGNTNGPASAASAGTYPEQGCIYQFETSADCPDGYLYLIHKASYNKNYVVYEEQDRLPYFFSMYDSSAEIYGSYDLMDIDGAVTWSDQWQEYFVTEGYSILTPQDYDTNLSAATSSSASVIKFPVMAGVRYLCFATGSKMSLGYFIFSDTDIEIRTTGQNTDSDGNVLSSWDIALCEGNDNIPTGISEVTTSAPIDENAPIYNVAGMQVTKTAKGILIQDGKKFINK